MHDRLPVVRGAEAARGVTRPTHSNDGEGPYRSSRTTYPSGRPRRVRRHDLGPGRRAALAAGGDLPSVLLARREREALRTKLAGEIRAPSEARAVTDDVAMLRDEAHHTRFEAGMRDAA